MTRVISERLLVRAARGDHLDHGCAEVGLNRIAEPREQPATKLDQMETATPKNEANATPVP